ncbi:Purine nucleoside phosphorylase [Streptococcus infantarius subsp. infantarius]|nr:Purine nucleoside phosphorylase [Streptococcus infantarius subsp. infantarius]MCO4610843.1 Purine nucleoside phosphorylase [Streptococcus infantarius subsp. infantarius]
MGERCKYNGGHNYNRDLVDYVADKEVITICPEVLAGLPTPREPVELVDGHVLDKMGNCYDDLFEKGIERCVNEISGKQIDLAVLQSRSP